MLRRWLPKEILSDKAIEIVPVHILDCQAWSLLSWARVCYDTIDWMMMATTILEKVIAMFGLLQFWILTSICVMNIYATIVTVRVGFTLNVEIAAKLSVLTCPRFFQVANKCCVT